MKFFRITAAVTALLCLVSCVNNNQDGSVPDDKHTFIAINEPNSRTSLNGNLEIIWSTTDTIDVFTAEGKSYVFKDVTVSQDGKEAQFTGEIPISSGYYALYPHNPEAYYEVGCIFTCVPSVQNAVSGSFDPKANVAVSEAKSDNLYFKNIGGLLGIKINNDDITDIFLFGSEAENGDLTGDCGIELTDGIPKATSLGGENYVNLKGEFIKGNKYYAVVLPGAYSNLEITFKDKKGRTATFTNSKVLTVKRNELIDIIDITVKEEDWEEEASSNWTRVTSTSALVAGNKFILACNYSSKDNEEYCVVASKMKDNYLAEVDATSYISADKNTFSATPENALIFTLGGSTDKWTLSDPDGNILGVKEAKKLIWNSNVTTWKISFNSGDAVIASTTANYGQFAYNQSAPRFTTYSTSFGKAVQLYSRSNTSTVSTSTDATQITKEGATLSGSYICVKSIPSEAGFYYGKSETSMTAAIYAATPTQMSATFTASLTGLSAETTYYYKAFVKEGTVFRYGNVCSFKTASAGGGGGTTGKADYNWPELPAQTDKDRNGIDDNNPDYYYSHTMRADASNIRNFSSCYSKSKIHPVWVAAPMHSCYLGSSGRNDSYKNDPNISCTQSAKFNGYTRGHMVGSSDRTVSVATNRQAFYYSNIGAQTQTGFNTGGGAWNKLEEKVDTYLCSDTLYQVIGCIFDTFKDKYGTTVSAKTGSGSAGTFQVPTAWYKVLLRTKKGNTGKKVADCSESELQCVAFILGHYSNQSHVPSVNDMYSVEDVEKLTGLTFFVNVPNAPKSTFTASDWGL